MPKWHDIEYNKRSTEIQNIYHIYNTLYYIFNITHFISWRFTYMCNITVASWWVRWRLKSPASRLFTQPFIQVQIKENIKAQRHWPCAGNLPVSDECPHKGPVTRKMLPFDDVIMNFTALDNIESIITCFAAHGAQVTQVHFRFNDRSSCSWRT